MNNILKNKKIIISEIVVLLLLCFFVFLTPEKAQAAAICKILKEGDATSNSIKAVWGSFIQTMDYLILAVLILVAFAQILRINVDTYGIKKILPTLILAIVAAQFSYKIVQWLVDIANVAITFLNTLGSSKDASAMNTVKDFLATGISPEFSWPLPSNFFTWLVNELFVIVASIEMIILALLFEIRAWIIYILTAIAPLAFMALILPQTKTYFTKWFTEISKWIFMPLSSLGIIWIGVRLGPVVVAGGGTFGALTLAIFYAVILYLAITVPMKSGGVIFDKAFEWTGAKFLTDKAKEYGTTRIKAKGMAQWNRWRRTGLDMQRQGRTGVARWIGRNWLGSGLDKAQADLKHEEAMAAGIKEGVQARRYFNRGLALQSSRDYIKNREGEIKEFERYAILRLKELGVQKPNNRYYKQWQDWKISSGQARAKMAIADSIENGQTNMGQYLWLSGGGQRKDFESDESFDKRKQAYFRQVREKAKMVVGPDGKKKLVAPDWETFNEIVQQARSDEETAKAGMEKMLNDASVKPALKQAQIHERELISQMMDQIHTADAALTAQGKTLVSYLEATGKTISQLTDAEILATGAAKKEVENIKEMYSLKRRAQNILASQNLLHEGEELTAANFSGIHSRVKQNKQDIIDDMNNQIKKKGHLSSYIEELADIDGRTGKVKGLKLMERVIYTRKKGVSMSKTNKRATDDYGKRAPEETVDIFFGSDYKDGLTEDLTARLRNGDVVLDANRESRLVANAEGVRIHLHSSKTGERTTEAIVNKAPEDKVFELANHWIREEVARPHSSDTGKNGGGVQYKALQDAISKRDLAATRQAMMNYYQSYQKHSDRETLINVIDRFVLPGHST